MRFFELLNFRHVVLFLFPTLAFIILFSLGLRRVYFRTRYSDEKERKVTHVFPGGIEEKDSPFPLILLLIILGFVLWAIFYALGTGVLGVKI